MLIDAAFHSPSRPRAERGLLPTSQVIDSTNADPALNCVRLGQLDLLSIPFEDFVVHFHLLQQTYHENFSNLAY